jgi:hypothetical protein
MINDKLDKIDSKVTDLKIDVASLPEKILEKVDIKINVSKLEAEKKFASKEGLKNVQKIVYSMAGAILLAVLYSILKSIGLNF